MEGRDRKPAKDSLRTKRKTDSQVPGLDAVPGDEQITRPLEKEPKRVYERK